eukprot:m.332768 g.332768  ORF g.332768 m.332768 type:complete len:430 (-) comp17004_c0_seq1:35-1324(-)
MGRDRDRDRRDRSRERDRRERDRDQDRDRDRERDRDRDRERRKRSRSPKEKVKEKKEEEKKPEEKKEEVPVDDEAAKKKAARLKKLAEFKAQLKAKEGQEPPAVPVTVTPKVEQGEDKFDEAAIKAAREEQLRKRKQKVEEFQQAHPELVQPGPAKQFAVPTIVPDTSTADDEDELDMFMKGVNEEGQRLLEQTAIKEAKEEDLRRRGLLNVEEASSKLGPAPINPNKRCYICKAIGHTKGECPLARCYTCGDTGHRQFDCPIWKEQEAERLVEEKKRKRQNQYHLKKMKKRHEWDEHLRRNTGVRGYIALYEVLGLPINKLANEATIKQAFRRVSLIWHPDKHMGKDTEEEAKQKFMEIKAAYDLLLEGLEKGNVDGVTVSSAGELGGDKQAALAPKPITREELQEKLKMVQKIKERIKAEAASKNKQ